ncbi:MAG: hypothetical protein ACTH6Y_13855 [Vibrio hibernica]
MKQIDKTAPSCAIPKNGTKVHKFLMMLSSGKPVAKTKFLHEFGESMRSPLQQLESEKYQWWNIKRVSIDDVPYLQLDERHLSGDWEQDKLARLERRRELAGESYTQASKEKMRLKSAERELLESEIEYRTFLCELENRNDSDDMENAQPKPSV